MTAHKKGATLADWLAFNGLQKNIVSNLLENAAIRNIEECYTGTNLFASTNAEFIWNEAKCAFACESTFTDFTQLDRLVRHEFEPSLTDDRSPFALIDASGSIIVHVGYSFCASDALMIAHELGHAIQLSLAGDTMMPPVYREVTAFLSEMIYMRHMQKQCTAIHKSLMFSHKADVAGYFNNDSSQLLSAICSDLEAPYNYRWNYPIAYIIAEHLWAEHDICYEQYYKHTPDNLMRGNIILKELAQKSS